MSVREKIDVFQKHSILWYNEGIRGRKVRNKEKKKNTFVFKLHVEKAQWGS